MDPFRIIKDFLRHHGDTGEHLKITEETLGLLGKHSSKVKGNQDKLPTPTS